MAEAEVTIRYKSPAAVAGSLVLMGALPVAVIFMIWSSAVILVSVADGVIKGGPSAFLLLTQLCTLVLIGAGALSLSDRTIFITRQGISLPFWMRPAFSWRSQGNWSDLTQIMFTENRIILLFEKGRPAKLSLARMTPLEAEQLLVSLEVWAGGAEKYPAIEEAKEQAQIAAGGASIQRSYTEMWSEELTRRFGATNFIPLEPGTKSWQGKLVVDRQLAFGGFSAIYLVKDAKKHEFILKEAVVPDDADPQMKAEAARLFERESKLLSELVHPRIARVFDSYVENGRQYLLLEYIPGQDLRQLVRKNGKQRAETVTRWASELADVIAYLHAGTVPVIHRDISPDNLIVDEQNSLHLIDFGAANLFLGTATGTMIGKQAYMAPEQFRGKANVKSDVYGFGCTLYFLLTGKDPEALSVCRVSDQGVEISRQLDDLIARCTAPEDEERPAIAEVATHLSVLMESAELAAVGTIALGTTAAGTTATETSAEMTASGTTAAGTTVTGTSAEMTV